MHAVGGYFKAQFKIMGVIYVILLIGLLILRVDFAWLIAFGIAFLDMLPVISLSLSAIKKYAASSPTTMPTIVSGRLYANSPIAPSVAESELDTKFVKKS